MGAFILGNDGTISAWGENPSGVLGVGPQWGARVSMGSGATIPGIHADTLKNLVISRKYTHNMAYIIDSNGELYGWGNNSDDLLGFGQSLNEDTIYIPRQVVFAGDNSRITSIQMNNNGQSFALTENGKLYGWGRNSQGTLGLGTGSATQIFLPQEIMINVRQVHTVGETTYVVTNDDKLYRWGMIQSTGSIDPQATPEPVVRPSATNPGQMEEVDQVREIFSARNQVYAIQNDGTLLAWGSNQNGLLGIGVTPEHFIVYPQQVSFPGGEAAKKVYGI